MACAFEEPSSPAGVSEPINLKNMLDEIRTDAFSRHFESGLSLKEFSRKIMPEFDKDFDEVKESFHIDRLYSDIDEKSSIKIFNISEEEDEEELEATRARHLESGTKITKTTKKKIFEIPKGNELETLKYQKKDVDERCENKKYALMVRNDMHTSINPYTELIVKRNKKKISNAITLPELLLTVKIYHHIKKAKTKSMAKDMTRPTTKDKKCRTTKDKKRRKTKHTTRRKTKDTAEDKTNPTNEPQQIKLVPSQEFLVIGHQDLTDFRDKILCPSDNFTPGDFSENPDAPRSETLKDLYPSGFIFINGTFYNDMRSPNSIDISKVIRDWAEKKPDGTGPYTAQSMEGIQFIDLTIQLGHPYVFCHLGDCEHMFIFTAVRAMNKDDSLDPKSYPKVNKCIQKNRTSCMFCQMFTAIWSVTGDMLPMSPQFICDDCLRGFFYTEDGKKNAEFELRKFCDQSEIV